MVNSWWARSFALAWLFSILGPALSGCRLGGSDKPLMSKLQTLAELRTVKRGVSVTLPGEAPRAPYPRERLVDGQAVRIEPGGLAWLRRDGGATLLVKGPAELVLRADLVAVTRGKIFADTQSTEPAMIRTPSGTLQLADVRASVDVGDDGAVRAYVLEGGVQTEGGVVARPGELLVLGPGPGGKATKAPATVWDDWTGGLATTDPVARPAPFGIGTVGARTPGQNGEARFALAIQRLDVKVKIDGDFATTEVDELFFNPTSDTVEGLYRFRTPEGAVLARFGVDRDGELVWGRIKEKEAAAAQYQAHVYQGSTEDPALLEWDAPGVYRARLYPIGPGATRRVVTRYGQWLPRQGPGGERRLYVYPMAAEGAASSLPRIEEFSADFDLSLARATEARVGMLGKQSGKHVVVKGFDFVPRSDLALELLDAGGSGWTAYRAGHVVDREITPKDQLERAQKDARSEADYVLVPIRPTRGKEPPGGLDLAIIVDSSAAIEPGSLAIARAMTGALLSHLGPTDRAAVWAGDATLRPVAEGSERFLPVDAPRRELITTGLAQIDRGGATDLGALISEAATRLDAGRRGAIVYLGDGQPTVGELAVKELRGRLERLPRPVRLFAIGVGDGANMGILKGMAKGAVAERVTDAFGAAEAALRVLEEAERPVWLGAEIDLGPGIDRVFPRELGALAADETALVVGRVVGALPRDVRLEGSGGDVTARLAVGAIADGGDLKRRWAEGRLDQLLEEGAGRAALVEVGVRFGVVTPVTSFYVPTADEHRREMSQVVASLAEEPTKPWWRWPWFTSLGLGRTVGYAPTARLESMPIEVEADDKEGGTGTRAKGDEGALGKAAPAAAAPAQGNKRYAVQGPKNEPMAMPRKDIEAEAPAERHPDPQIARQGALREADDFGIIGLLNQGAAGDPAPPESPTVPADAATAKEEAKSKPSTTASGGAAPARSAAAAPSTLGAIGNAFGDEIADASGAGGLGLSGIGEGEGGGGRGDGVGLGSIGTLGQGAGEGTGQGFGAGHGPGSGVRTPRRRRRSAWARRRCPAPCRPRSSSASCVRTSAVSASATSRASRALRTSAGAFPSGW